MAITWPVTADALTNPSATDTTNNPSHATQHANANDAIEAIEAYLGTNASQTTPTGSGRVLRSTSATATEWADLVLTTDVTGVLPVANGGTNLSATTINQILYSSATNTIAGIATANSGVLVTSGAGVPSIATDIPTAVTIGGQYVYRVGGTDVSVADGGTGGSSASITLFNNITGYTAAGATGTTSTNIVFSTSPTLITPALGTPSALVLTNATGLPAASVLAGTFGTGAFVMDTALSIGTTPATAGHLRIPSAGTIQARNAANTINATLMTLDSNNVLNLSPADSASVNDSSTLNLGTGQYGLFIISTNQDRSAIFHLDNSTITEVSDPGSVFSTTVDTATSTNVYITGGNLTVQNKTGGARTYRMIIIR